MYKKMEAKKTDPKGRGEDYSAAAESARIALLKYQTLKLIGLEGLSFPAREVKRLLLIDEVVNIGKYISQQRDMDMAANR